MSNIKQQQQQIKKDIKDLQHIHVDDISLALDNYNYRVVSEDENYNTSSPGILELVESIKNQGLINPITVIKGGETVYEIVAGRRRFLACKLLGYEEIPCIVIDNNIKEAYLVGLAENIQRKNLKPLEEGLAFKKYMDLFNIKFYAELGRKLGKNEKYVRLRMQILDLPKHIQNAINNKELVFSILPLVHPIFNDKIRNEVLEMIYNNKLDIIEIEALVNLVKNYETTELQIKRLTEKQLKVSTELSLQQMLNDHNIDYIPGHFKHNRKEVSDLNYNDLVEIAKTKQTIREIGDRMKYRSKFEIITGIVKSIAEKTRYDSKNKVYRGLNHTKVMYVNLLSYSQVKEYTSFLLDKKMVFIIEIKNSNNKLHSMEYVVTKKGLEFIESANKLFKMVDIEEYELEASSIQNMSYYKVLEKEEIIKK